VELEIRVALLEQAHRVLEERVDELEAEVITGEGLPANRLSMRSRLHLLEGAKAAQSAAESAVSALKSDAHANRADRRASLATWLTVFNAAIAGAAVLFSIFHHG
jgi:hypothetical protein